jgi:CHAT domain-containing protein/tetratricopeptide (TPR) repeat protein
MSCTNLKVSLTLIIALAPLTEGYSQSISAGDLPALVSRAKNLQQSYQFDSSTVWYEKAITAYEELADFCTVYRLRNEVAYNLLDAARDQEALDYIDDCLREFQYSQHCPDTLLQINLLISRHIIYRDVDRIKQSKPPLDEALRLATLSGDTASLAKIYNNLAAYYGSEGANYLALDCAEKSMEMKEQLLPPKDPSYLRGLYAIANYSERTGDYEKAYLYLDSIIQIAADTVYPNIADTYHLMSLVCLRRKDFTIARKYAELSTVYFSRQFGPESRAASYGYMELGMAHLALREMEEAIDNLERAFKIRRDRFGPADRLTLSTLSQLVKAQMIMGDTLSSIERYKQIVQDFTREYEVSKSEKYALNLLEIGELYKGAGLSDSALHYYRRGWELANQYFPAGDRVHSRANLLLSGAVPLGQREHYSRMALFHLTGDSSLHQLNRSTIAFANDQYAVLMVYYQHAKNLFAGFEETQDQRYLEKLITLQPQFDLIKDEIFGQFLAAKSIVEAAPIIREISLLRLRSSHLLYQKTGDLQYLDQALLAMEENKNILLQTQIHEKNLKYLLNLPDSLLRLERQLHLEINELDLANRQQENDSLRQRKLDLERAYFDLRRNILLQSKKIDHWTSRRNLTITEIRKNISDDLQIIHYFMDRDELYILSLSKNNQELNRQAFAATDIQNLADFIERLQKPTGTLDDKDLWNYAHSLYVKLIPGNIAPQITRLAILPDNELFMIPFDVLLEEKPRPDQSLADWPFLIRKYEITYLSGLTNPSLQNDHRQAALSVAFAPFVPGIDPGSVNLPILKHSEGEVEIIEDLFRVQKYTGKDATEERFKQLSNRLNILHIASHAIVNDERPLQSNILFYPSEGSDDGKLELWELYTMDIPANLAVLSACQASDGTLLKGAGMLNLSRGFYTAGTDQVISNLWPVQDYAARQLMQLFYSALKERMDATKALRQAKLQYMNREIGPVAHPAYWGGWMIQQSGLPNPESKLAVSWWWLILSGFMLGLAGWLYLREKKLV